MKWASAASSHHILGTAIEDCVSSIRPEMAETPLDLAVLFVSSHFSEEYDSIPAIIQDKLGARVLFGCSGGGVIGGGREIENRPGCSLTVASLPGVDLVPFYLNGDDLPDLDSGPDSWEGAVGVTAESSPHFLLLLDPFSFPAQDFIQGMDFAFPRSVKVGGMASGGHRSGENALYLEDRAYRAGAIGLAMRGNLVVDTIVAQGCRPIGQLMCITKSQQNLLLELDGQPPLEVVQRLFSSSSERDREMMQNSLFLGMVMDDVIEEPQLGDFLIRNVIGLDSRTGTMAIGETLREGQRVQFHLRDALTSAEELADLLARHASQEKGSRSQGSLLFSCLGRGEHLYGRPDHDTDLFRDKVGPIPLGGFFCNGEIGPVGSTTFLHGYTSSFGIFRPLSE